METIKQIIADLSDHNHSYIRSLALFHHLRGTLLASAVDHLELPADSHGLDVGCGIGLPAAVAVSQQRLRITGVDMEPAFIETAREIAARTGLEERLRFARGSAESLDFEDNCFDWVWSVDCVCYDRNLGQNVVAEIKRVLKPGGKLALMAYSSQLLLPGHPRLEARLNATSQGLAPFAHGMAPERHFSRAGSVFKYFGFKDIRAKTFIKDLQAPFSRDMVRSIRDLWRMRWGVKPGGISTRDRARYEALTDPGSGAYILNAPDYYGFLTYTLFSGINR